MSSHFIPLPRSSMISESSSGDHLLCFLAGESELCGGMVRFAPAGNAGTPTLDTPGRGPPYGDGRAAGGAVTATEGKAAGEDVVRCWVGDAEDSFESEALRSEAISTVTVARRRYLGGSWYHERMTRAS